MALTHDQALDWLRARGEFTRTTRKLAEDWGVSIGSVSSWLSRWEREGLIVREKSPDGMFIRLVQQKSVRLNRKRSADDAAEGVQPEQYPERSVEASVQRSHDDLTNASGTPVQPATTASVQRSDDDVANAEQAVSEHLNRITNQRDKKRSARPLGKTLNALNSDLNAALLNGLPAVLNAEQADRLPAVQRSRDDLANAKRSSVQSSPRPVQVNDTDSLNAPEYDPIAESMNAALGPLASPEGATRSRMPVPKTTTAVLAMVTGMTGKVLAPDESQSRFRLTLPPDPLKGRDWRIGPRIVAVIAAALGAVAAWEAWEITTWYGYQIAADPAAQRIYAKAGQIFVLANVLVPMVCGLLAAEGHYLTAWLGRLLWASTIVVFCVLASTGFSARNLSDTTALREAAASHRKAIESRRETKVRELAGLPATRTIDVIDVALQQAQPRVAPAIWRSSKGCTDVTAPTSGEACTEVLRLRQEQASASRRNVLTSEIAAADLELAEAPKIADADPQVTMAVRLMNRLPWVEGNAEDVKDLRTSSLVIGIEILPAFLFASAAALWFGRRRRVQA